MAERDYHFPYPPYAIQKQLMDQIYDSLEQGNAAVLESPTGTGKTLSVICGAATWLLDQKFRVPTSPKRKSKSSGDSAEKNSEESSVPAWLLDFSAQSADTTAEDLNRLIQTRKQKRQERLRLWKLGLSATPSVKIHGTAKRMKTTKPVTPGKVGTVEADNEEVVNYDSDKDERLRDVQRLVENGFRDYDDAADENEDSQTAQTLKIFYCSRTHSQLSQFVEEFRKTWFADKLTVLPLASRSNLCIHDSVKNLGNSSAVNEACQDLRDRSKCEYASRDNIRHLADEVLSQVCDIESLVSNGKNACACPYFSSRIAVPDAEIVLAPYSVLLSKSTRESLGISLKNQIVIFDEAHNLADAIGSSHASILTATQLQNVTTQLQAYKKKYEARLSAKTARYVMQLAMLCELYHSFLTSSTSTSGKQDDRTVMTIQEFSMHSKTESMDLFHMYRFLEGSLIVRKLYSVLAPGGKNDAYAVRSFLAMLVSQDDNCRILVDSSHQTISFFLLNPSAPFADVLNEARAVICVGGTMQPFDEFTRYIFAGLNRERKEIRLFSCSHVVDRRNLECFVLGSGQRGHTLHFTHDAKGNVEMVLDLGESIADLSRMVPGGIVLFFPSYATEERMMDAWKQHGILGRIHQAGKMLFREPKKAADADSVLQQYAAQCLQGTGGILSSVVGGKLSEGINFSDDLGRAVVVIGLPYPPPYDAEVQAKMRFLDAHPDIGLTGKEFYENICVKRVNQSVGRAIRHRNDYAIIVLADERFAQPRAIASLPKWIQDGRTISKISHADMVPKVQAFFASRKDM